MGDEFIFGTQMARQTQPGARHVILCRIHTPRHIIGMGCAGLHMALDPTISWSVTRFAGYAIGNLKALCALRRFGIVRVAIKTQVALVCGLGQCQLLGDRFRFVVQQHGVGSGVLVGARPSHIFILEHIGIAPGFYRTVAQAAGATTYPKCLVM